MLEFCDAPYRFFPSKPLAPIISLSRWGNSKFSLPGKTHLITRIDLEGAMEDVQRLNQDQNTRLLFVTNHPTHSDPQTFTEVQRRLNIKTCFMAAYDVFLRGKLAAWIMQRNGAFSIDREGSDRKAMAAAVDILAGGSYGLSIFPEGNVHFTNDRVTPFLDGAAFIALRAQKALAEGQRVMVVPVGMKFSHLDDVREQVWNSLAELGSSIGEEIDSDSDPVQELLKVGRAVLLRNLVKRGFITVRERDEMEEGGCIFESLEKGAEQILLQLEKKMDLSVKDTDSLVERVRKVRAGIHQVLSDPSQLIDHDVASSWAKEAILAVRILGYRNPYTAEKPTLDRFAETVERMNEDLYNRSTPEPFGPRVAIAGIGEPIDVSEIMAENPKTRSAVNALTGLCEASVQSSIDRINENLETEGSQMFARP